MSNQRTLRSQTFDPPINDAAPSRNNSEGDPSDRGETPSLSLEQRLEAAKAEKERLLKEKELQNIRKKIETLLAGT